MTLLLSEADVREVLTMPLALEVIEEAFRRQAAGQIILHTRRRLEAPEKAFLHYMAAADTVSGYMGMKIYTSVRGALRFLVPLYSGKNGELLALLEADYLGQMRTGAASGLATKYMSRSDARTVGLIGTGLQRSEEHTSELQSLAYLVCRLLLEKKKNNKALIIQAGYKAAHIRRHGRIDTT